MNKTHGGDNILKVSDIVSLSLVPVWLVHGYRASRASTHFYQRAHILVDLNFRLDTNRTAALTPITIPNGLHGDRHVDEDCVILLRVVPVPVRLIYSCRTVRVKAGG